MLTARQDAIRDLLDQEGRLAVADLADQFAVTPMTIRRDLASMEAAGVLTRTHGGCVPAPSFVPELPYQEKEQQQRAEKLAIAQAVAGAIPAGAALYLDTGSTSAQVARYLPRDAGLRVFTSNLVAALELYGRSDVAVTVFGGELAAQSPELTGEFTLAQVRTFRFDAAVVGADAADASKGEFYAADLATATLSRVAQEQSARTYVALDHSKFGKTSLTVSGRFSERTTVVTDSGLAPSMRKALSRHRAAVRVASS